jgi:hypothetical protein
MSQSEFLFYRVRAYTIVSVVIYAVLILIQASALFSIVAYEVSALPIGMIACEVLALLIGVATGVWDKLFYTEKNPQRNQRKRRV